jgi:predicted amidohydrolase YtcJ
MKSVLLKNARIYTMNIDQPFATEMRIDENKITAVGQYLDDSGCKAIDLKGKTVLPGFIDAHCHIFENIQLSGGILLDAMMTKQDVDDTIRDFIAAHPNQKNYFGIGYPEWIYEPGDVTRQHLDALCPDKPLFLRSNGGHESWCNTKAFEALGITKDTPDPEGGVFDREADGMPNGHLNEMALAQLFTDGIEWFDLSQLSHNADKVLGRYAAAGVTGIIDCGCFEKTRETLMDMLHQWAKVQTLTQWISNCCATEYADDFPELLPQLQRESQKYCHPLFFNHTLKVVNDGTVETGTAALSSEMTGGDPVG